MKKSIEEMMEALKNKESELEFYQKKKEQIQHEIDRCVNRTRYYEKKNQKLRVHRLCLRAGMIDKIIPETLALSDTDFFGLIEQTAALPEFQSCLASFLCRSEDGMEKNTETETEEEDGSLPLSRDTD